MSFPLNPQNLSEVSNPYVPSNNDASSYNFKTLTIAEYKTRKAAGLFAQKNKDPRTPSIPQTATSVEQEQTERLFKEKRKNQETEETSQVLKRRFKEKSSELAELSRSSSEQALKLIDTEDELSIFRTKSEQLEKRLTESEAQLHQEAEKYRNEIQILKSEIEDLREALQSAEVNTSDFQSQLIKARQDLTQKETEFALVQSKYEEVTRQMESVKKINKDVSDENDGLRNRLAVNEKHLSEIRTENQRLRQELLLNKKLRSNTEKEAEIWQCKFTESESFLAQRDLTLLKTRAHAADLAAENEKLKLQLQKSKNQTSKMEVEIERMKEEIKSWRNQPVEREREFLQAQRRAKELEFDNAELRKQFKSSQELVALMERENMILKNKLVQGERDILHLMQNQS